MLLSDWSSARSGSQSNIHVQRAIANENALVLSTNRSVCMQSENSFVLGFGTPHQLSEQYTRSTPASLVENYIPLPTHPTHPTIFRLPTPVIRTHSDDKHLSSTWQLPNAGIVRLPGAQFALGPRPATTVLRTGNGACHDIFSASNTLRSILLLPHDHLHCHSVFLTVYLVTASLAFVLNSSSQTVLLSIF